jgi:hypothetical protein
VACQRHDAHRTEAGNSGGGLGDLFEQLEPCQLLSQRCKAENFELSPVPLGFRDGEVHLPRGVDSTHSPLRLLRRLMQSSRYPNSFDRLPSWSGTRRWAA